MQLQAQCGELVGGFNCLIPIRHRGSARNYQPYKTNIPARENHMTVTCLLLTWEIEVMIDDDSDLAMYPRNRPIKFQQSIVAISFSLLLFVFPLGFLKTSNDRTTLKAKTL